MVLKVYTSEAKGFKVKVRKFGGLIPTFLEVIGENQVGGKGAFYSPPLFSPQSKWGKMFNVKKSSNKIKIFLKVTIISFFVL